MEKRIETNRFGVFKFQVGLSEQDSETILQRVIDAQTRFSSSPLATVASSLEKEVVVSSVFGTNTIEGGELSEDETEQALQLSSEEVQNIQQKRAVNIRNAYDYIRKVAVQENWHPCLQDIREIHRLVYDGLESDHELNQPGILRDNPDGIITNVGNSEHGGIYKPPQFGGDIKLLLESLLEWNVELVEQGVPTLIRAPLVHLYFELIHPFWDGNGRVGRVLEAGILYADGFRYAPFAQANYYLKNIHQYFALFNECRKAAKKKHDNPNNEFIIFFLKGMFETINHLHDRVNDLVHVVLFQAAVKNMHDEKKINKRQYAIINAVLQSQSIMTLKKLKSEPWFDALYAKLTDKTMSRDLAQLKELELIRVDDKNQVMPGFIKSL